MCGLFLFLDKAVFRWFDNELLVDGLVILFYKTSYVCTSTSVFSFLLLCYLTDSYFYFFDELDTLFDSLFLSISWLFMVLIRILF